MSVATPYQPVFAVEARAEYDRLSPEQRHIIDTAVDILARDPYNDRATRPDGPDARRAFLTPDLTVRYGIHQHHLVIAEINSQAPTSFLIGAE